MLPIMKSQDNQTGPGRTLTLPRRSEKPRETGLTAVTDIGVPLRELANILEAYSRFIDIAKLGIGSAYLEPCLKEKINLYAEYDIPVYFGGTLFEKFFIQDKLDDYLIFLDHLGITWIELSAGIIDLPIEKTVSLVQRLKQDFTTLVEVGKKKEDFPMPVGEWRSCVVSALNAGCRYVILEGRNTADTGIFHSDGTLDRFLIQEILKTTGSHRLIFETPTPKSQSQIINLIGSNANLGNIFVRDLLLLETQRHGLREDTFFIT